MVMTADRGSVVLHKSCHVVRKVAGLEKLKTLERLISPDQVCLLFADYPEENVSVDMCFFPHVLFHIKFSKEDPRKGSQEGQLLWSLVDGELVLDTDTWTKTQGFKECLLLQANQQDMVVMQTLSRLGGAVSRDTLLQALMMKHAKADQMIRKCQKKKLVFVYAGDKIGYHFRQPQFVQGCTTRMHREPVLLRKTRGMSLWPNTYSEDRIKELASMVFGQNFFIINTEEVYVPVYKVMLRSPEDSVRIQYVNAVNGEVFSL